MSKKWDYSNAEVRKVTWNELIRLRPGMYIGSVNEKGFTNMLENFMTTLIVDAGTDKFSLELKDNLEAKFIFHNQHGTLKNSWGKLPTNFKEPFRIDFCVLNALSKQFRISFWDINNKKITEQYFEKGELINGNEIDKIDCSKVEIKFTLDEDIWKMNTPWNTTYITNQLREFAFLNKKVKFEINYKVDNEECRLIYHFKNGLSDRINLELLNGLGGSYFKTVIDTPINDFHIELAFAFRDYSVDYTFIKSYVNNSFTSENGTHVDGLLKGLTYGVMKYFQKYKLINQYKISEKGIKENLVAAIHIKMKAPQYGGCVKNKLINSDIIEPIADFVTELFFQKMEEDEVATKRLIKKFEM